MYQAMICSAASTDSALARVLALALVTVLLSAVVAAVVVTYAAVVSSVSFLLQSPSAVS